MLNSRRVHPGHMNLEMLSIAALSVFAIASSVVLVVRDGYRRVPTRRA